MGLHCLRILSGLLFLSWLLPLTGHQAELFGLNGWLDAQGYREASQLPGGPPGSIGWSLVFLFGTDAASLTVFWWLAIGVLVLFTLGVATRVTAVLTWLVVVSFLATPAATYDADFLLVVLAFYLMVGYLLLGVWSALHGESATFRAGFTWIKSGQNAPPSYAANLAVRLFQVHFAIIVVASGLHKLQFGDWWSGMGLWYPLHPPFSLDAEKLRALTADRWVTWFFHSAIQYPMLAWQLAFPAFAWRRRRLWRILLLGGGVLGWIGCVIVYGLPLFGPFFLIGCLSYLTPAEWHGLLAPLKAALRLLTRSRTAPAAPKAGVRLGSRSG